MIQKQVHIIVSGIVQGVFFRASTQEKALELGVCGWVKNLPGGDVEILAKANDETLQEFLDWVKVGPPAAKVMNVQTKWSEPSGKEISFKIL